MGYFRALGELLCAPANLKTPAGHHPLAPYFDLAAEVQAHPTGTVADARHLPTAALISFPQRCMTFDAKWASEGQLILSLGIRIARELEWGPEMKNPKHVFVMPRDGLLFMLSNTRYSEIRSESPENWLPADE